MDEVLSVHFNGFLDGSKTELDPVGGGTVGMLLILIRFAESASKFITSLEDDATDSPTHITVN